MAVEYKCPQCGAVLDIRDEECRYCGEIIKKNVNVNNLNNPINQNYPNRNNNNLRRPMKPYKSSFSKTHKIIGWTIMILMALCYLGGFIGSISSS
jgi:uncharacterized membrane protein YvbJ